VRYRSILISLFQVTLKNGYPFVAHQFGESEYIGPIPEHGEGKSAAKVVQSRFYISSSDVANAVLFLIEHARIGESYNIVGKKEINNLDHANIVADSVGQEFIYELVDFHTSRPGHDLRYALLGKNIEIMGCKSIGIVEEQIKEVVQWTIANARWLY
jgi:dTDP-D-glucose 4,6-dehydratase